MLFDEGMQIRGSARSECRVSIILYLLGYNVDEIDEDPLALQMEDELQAQMNLY